MLATAKERTPSRCGAVCADLPLAVNLPLSENSPQGFATKNTALHQGFELRNSTTALGMRGTLALNRIGKSDRARYYDPNTGRFITEDPMGFWTGFDFYTYVDNDPIDLSDPTGNSDACAFGGCSTHKPKPGALPDEQFLDAAIDMWRNFRRMQYRSWKGADKYYHCMATCQATNHGTGGAAAAKVISFFRTNVRSRFTEPTDWKNDDKANKCGQKGGNCDSLCSQFIPKSSPGKPPFPGW